MSRVIAIIVLVTFFPMQLYALDFRGLGSDTQIEYTVPRGADRSLESPEQRLAEKVMDQPPKAVEVESTGTNWWMWGGLAVVAGGIVALAAGVSKGGGGTGGTGGGSTKTTVNVSW